MEDKIIFLVGPTAVGKSQVAVSLAKKINAEIISCDSMQIYKGTNILTSQPAASLKKKVRHHLINFVSPTKEYNVARYRQHALKKIREILKRHKLPLFVGGTGLYVSVMLDGIFKAKSQDKTMRRRLYQIAGRLGSAYLYNKLQKVDSQAARKIHPHDTRRIIRALEAFETSGRPISELQKQRRGLFDKYDVKIFCLNMEREKLYQRIERRIDRMFAQGLLKEAKRLLKLKLSQTASSAIGIKELRDYFQRQYDLNEAQRLMKRNTRRYTKRQLTWFRKDKRIKWLEVGESESPQSVANRIFGMIVASAREQHPAAK